MCVCLSLHFQQEIYLLKSDLQIQSNQSECDLLQCVHSYNSILIEINSNQCCNNNIFCQCFIYFIHRICVFFFILFLFVFGLSAVFLLSINSVITHRNIFFCLHRYKIAQWKKKLNAMSTTNVNCKISLCILLYVIQWFIRCSCIIPYDNM